MQASAETAVQLSTAVQCRICGFKYGRLTARHLATHGLTTAQYRDAYEGGLRTCSSCGCSKPATTEFFYQNGPRLSSMCRDCARHQAVVDERVRDAKKTAERQKLADQPGVVVQCQVCGIWYDQITATHLQTHGTTVESYRIQFPGALLQSDAVKDRTVEAHGFDEEFRQKRRDCMIAFWDSPEADTRRAKIILRPKRLAAYDTVAVPTHLHGAIVGMLLGDSGMSGRAFDRKHAHMCLGHSEKQLPYLEWKVELLGPLIPSSVSGIAKYSQKDASPFYTTFTIAHPHFTRLRDLAYGEGGKRFVTPELTAPLNDLGLALWYQDDGSFSGGTVTLATHSFTEASHDFMVQMLGEKFGIEATKQRHYDQFVLYIRRSSQARFFSLVASHIHPCMRYKLPPAEST